MSHVRTRAAVAEQKPGPPRLVPCPGVLLISTTRQAHSRPLAVLSWSVVSSATNAGRSNSVGNRPSRWHRTPALSSDAEPGPFAIEVGPLGVMCLLQRIAQVTTFLNLPGRRWCARELSRVLRSGHHGGPSAIRGWGMSEGADVLDGQLEQDGPAWWLALACLVGLFVAYVVLTNFTGELRAALWGEPGTVTKARCRTYDNTVANAGTSTSCSGTFTSDDGNSSFDVTVEGDIRSQPVRAWLAGGTSGTAYVSPTLWTGVLPVGVSLLLVVVPAAVTVEHARRVRIQRLRPTPPARPGSRWPARRADDPGISDF